MLTGDVQASARYLTRAIEKKPDAIDPRVNLVAALLQKGDKPGAVQQAEELLKKSPNDVRSVAILIAALLENQQSARALEIVGQLEQKRPGSPIPLIYRAAIKVQTNDLDGAKVELKKSLQNTTRKCVGGAFPGRNCDQEKPIQRSAARLSAS